MCVCVCDVYLLLPMIFDASNDIINQEEVNPQAQIKRSSSNKRNKNIKKHGYLTDIELQERMNTLVRENQVNAVKEENRKHRTGCKGWWDVVNRITGRGSKPCIPSSINPEAMNTYFKKINTGDSYSAPETLHIPAHIRIPTIDVSTVHVTYPIFFDGQ